MSARIGVPALDPGIYPSGTLFSGFTGGSVYAVTPQLCLRRHHLFSRKRKDGGEKSAWGREIALTRRKTNRYTLRIIVTPAVKERPSGGVLANSISLASPQAAGLVRFVVPPFPARTASLGSRGSPAFAIPLKTTKKGLLPLLGFFPGVGLYKAYFKPPKNAVQMRIR